MVPVRSVRKPWWQQATALVTVSTGGVLTGFNFVPGAAVTMTSPTSVPLHLLALEQAARPGTLGDLAVGGDSAGQATSDAQLRAAIVNVAGYYLRLATTRTPAQMEALIAQKDPKDDAIRAFKAIDGDDKGFITLEDLKRVYANEPDLKATPELMRAMIDEFDMDGTGRITLDVFMSIMFS